MRKYHDSKGNQKKTILIPDAAHGTNPASVAMAGYKVVEIASNDRGMVDMDDFRSKINADVAGFMLTNPNTLGLFEPNLEEISELIHSVDGLMYMDGANMNALLGILQPSKVGFDITHLNLHKTFSTPHGGGGPGAGPIGVVPKLVEFLPTPMVEKRDDTYFLDYDRPNSIGRIHNSLGNYGVLVRAWTYIRMLGPEGLAEISRSAIINANYLRKKLESVYEVAFPQPCMHEFVLTAEREKKQGVKALDIAKRLLDYGYHSPTMYFPLIVKEALMIEPTDSESRDTLDHFVEVMEKIAQEIQDDPELVIHAPHTTLVRRVDETLANRQLNVRW
jgi:glycine dehydrogenase subunit 2